MITTFAFRSPLRSFGFAAFLFFAASLAATDQSLLSAARTDDQASIRRALKAGADPNSRDEHGATVLMYAGAFGSLETLQLLLDHRADVNAADTDGCTALMWSAGNAEKVRVLLSRGAYVNATSKQGGTALLSAALRHNIEAVRLLIAAGADPKAEMTALPGTPLKLSLPVIAFTTTSPELRDFLNETGRLPREAASVGIISGRRSSRASS